MARARSRMETDDFHRFRVDSPACVPRINLDLIKSEINGMKIFPRRVEADEMRMRFFLTFSGAPPPVRNDFSRLRNPAFQRQFREGGGTVIRRIEKRAVRRQRQMTRNRAVDLHKGNRFQPAAFIRPEGRDSSLFCSGNPRNSPVTKPGGRVADQIIDGFKVCEKIPRRIGPAFDERDAARLAGGIRYRIELR